jgi:cardiolipin synthase (CMP-forming)
MMTRKLSKKEDIYTIPNFLSAYRIVALPFIIGAIASGNKQLYITLLSINLISDILDGWIARTFKMETELGARLDSLADIGSYIMAFAGMIILEGDFVKAHSTAFTVMIILYTLPQITSLARFKRVTSFHLYSNKITGYVQGIFIFTYFNWRNSDLYFYLMITVSCLAYIEALIIVSSIPELRSNVKGLYFILKEHKRIV